MAQPRIPLTRPSFPHGRDFFERWRHVTNMTGLHSNFGTLWKEAARKIEHFVGGRYFALPVANGTDAVAVALAAAGCSFEEMPTINVEAFTFHATFCAAHMLNAHDVAPIATDAHVPEEELAVRTKWWGYDRDLSWTKAHDVVDAAGGFGDREAFESIGADSIVAVSFHATKNFPIGEGGCVLVPKHREQAAHVAKQAMCFGFDSERRVRGWGINAKLDELRCSLLLEQLDRRMFFAQRAAGIRKLVEILLSKIYDDCKQEMHLDIGNERLNVGPWASLPVLPVPRADELVAHLATRGIQARRTYDLAAGFDGYRPWQRHCVAFPADVTNGELDELLIEIETFYVKKEMSDAA
jgi:dTDP-4-amino-4,6-dideoxygalactose transaminase